MGEPIASIESLTLDLPPSCIEFCPAYLDYFCVGTYNLEKDGVKAHGDTSRSQSRSGSIVVFKVENNKAWPPNRRCIETIIQPSAILDLHFQSAEDKQDVFAVASSTATLSIFRLIPTNGDGSSSVQPVSVVRIDGNDDDVLFLSCAWHPTIPDLVAVSTSTGAVYIIALSQTQQMTHQLRFISKSPVLVHEMEAWTVAFSPFTQISDNQQQTTVTLYSGADDSSLRYTSCRYTGEGDLMQFGTCKLSTHEAGVTAILPVTITNSDGGHVIVTGSYDDNIRVFSIIDPVDTGGTRRAVCLANKNLGGGVWRLKLISQAVNDDSGQWHLRVLASCMHAGARVVDIHGDISGCCQIEVSTRFEEHKSMNYGSDFQAKSPLLCVSTSFYDKLICLWEAKTGAGDENHKHVTCVSI